VANTKDGTASLLQRQSSCSRRGMDFICVGQMTSLYREVSQAGLASVLSGLSSQTH
jgi:hypothetical protein